MFYVKCKSIPQVILVNSTPGPHDPREETDIQDPFSVSTWSSHRVGKGRSQKAQTGTGTHVLSPSKNTWFKIWHTWNLHPLGEHICLWWSWTWQISLDEIFLPFQTRHSTANEFGENNRTSLVG